MSVNLKHLASGRLLNWTQRRNFYYKFKRQKCPPLPEPRESPYIVGPYLKPDYLPVKYTTDAIKEKEVNDFDHLFYDVEKVEFDKERTVKLLLLDDVEGLGLVGDVVDAPFRFGASRLVAMKRADYATDFALSWHKFDKKKLKSASTALSPKTIRLLRTELFELPVRKDVELKPWHLRLALRLGKCQCPLEAIKEESIERFTGGEDESEAMAKCIVVVNNHETVEVKFRFVEKGSELDD